MTACRCLSLGDGARTLAVATALALIPAFSLNADFSEVSGEQGYDNYFGVGPS